MRYVIPGPLKKPINNERKPEVLKKAMVKTGGVLPYKEVVGVWPQNLPLKFVSEAQILPPKI